ncbi:MAG: efflux RND transporter periplasmic adaptor subunit [Rubrivivax sp.]|nr:efflux RND transporter periplasmic adaptor subunit [Rubrivivax sp.]
MKLHRRWVAASAAMLLMAVAGGAAYLRFGRTVDVATVRVEAGAVAQRVVGPGTVQARVPVTLSARITATVRRVDADIGDMVRRGQPLVLLDDRDLAAKRSVVDGQQAALARNLEAAQAGAARAEAELELARSRQRRDAELLNTGFVSPAALDTSNAALRAATANVDNATATQAARAAEARALAAEARYAEAVHSHARIVAPMDALVIARQVEVGSTVVPGSTLLRLVDPQSVWVVMRVDESVLGRIELGQPATIRLRTGETLRGKVARIARQSDAATRELDVNITFDTAPRRFAIDQEAEVAVEVGDVRGITIPLAALTRSREGRPGVLVVEGGRTAFRALETGAADNRRVLVLEGLAAGETIVARAEGVRTNVRVRALEPAAGAAAGAATGAATRAATGASAAAAAPAAAPEPPRR